MRRYLSTQFLSILTESRIEFHDVSWPWHGRASRNIAISANDALIVSTTKQEFYRVLLDNDTIFITISVELQTTRGVFEFLPSFFYSSESRHEATVGSRTRRTNDVALLVVA